MEPETIAEVRAALNEHKALVFRGVRLDDEDQQRFAGYFGPLTSAHPTVPAVDGGETLIANTGAAYRDLPDPLCAFADTLRAVHTNDYDYAVPPESLSEADRERREIFVSSITPWTTTTTRPGGCTASPWPVISRSASTAAPATPSRAMPPTTPRSPPSGPPRNQWPRADDDGYHRRVTAGSAAGRAQMGNPATA